MSKAFTLAHCCEFQEGYVNPTQKEPKYFGNDVKWLRASDLNDGYVFNTERLLSDAGYKSAGKSAKMFEKDTLAISKSGTIGSIGILKDRMCGNRAVINIVVNSDRSDLMYVFYTLKYKKNELVGKAGGSIQKNLYVSALETLTLNHQQLQDQKKIAAVLSALDAKIDCNNRINAELEAMAKTLYDYWFVQFDFPDANGKPYKFSGGKMAYNAMLKREIPEKWEAIELADVISRSGTGLNPRQNFQLGYGNNYYVTIKNVTNGKITLDHKCDRINDEALKIIDQRSQLQVGDVLFTSIEPVGVTYLIHKKPDNWNINESVFTIRPDFKKITSEYLFCLLSSSEMKVFTKNSSTGSIHKGIRHGVLKTYPLAYGGKGVIDKFSTVIRPMLKHMDVLENENQQLAQLRDWLLPMLMNGQVTVA